MMQEGATLSQSVRPAHASRGCSIDQQQSVQHMHACRTVLRGHGVLLVHAECCISSKAFSTCVQEGSVQQCSFQLVKEAEAAPGLVDLIALLRSCRWHIWPTSLNPRVPIRLRLCSIEVTFPGSLNSSSGSRTAEQRGGIIEGLGFEDSNS